MVASASLPITDEVAVLAEFDHLSAWMDDRWRIPGTGIRFGLDAVVGLVPGVGDAVSMAMGLYLVSLGWRLGVRASTLARMLANVVMDAVVGVLPVVGDLADVAWRANRRNLALVRADLADRGRNGGH